MTTSLKPVHREIPVERLPEIANGRPLIVTLEPWGVEFRGKGRHRTYSLTWEQIIARLDDLRKDLR